MGIATPARVGIRLGSLVHEHNVARRRGILLSSLLRHVTVFVTDSRGTTHQRLEHARASPSTKDSCSQYLFLTYFYLFAF